MSGEEEGEGGVRGMHPLGPHSLALVRAGEGVSPTSAVGAVKLNSKQSVSPLGARSVHMGCQVDMAPHSASKTPSISCFCRVKDSLCPIALVLNNIFSADLGKSLMPLSMSLVPFPPDP